MVKKGLILLTALILCGLSAFGQSGLVIFEPTHDFGPVEERGGEVAHIFVGENRGEHPEVIIAVTTTCGCTTPKYTRTPILPGERFTIEVHFDPAGRPGPFDKPLTVFDSKRREVARLRVRGSVIPRPRSIVESYPIAVAEGIRLTNNYLNLGNVQHGEERVLHLGVANTADEPRRLGFIYKVSSPYLRIEAPDRVEARGVAEVVVRYAVPEYASHYGTVEDRLEIQVDGHASGIPFTVSALLVDAPEAVIGEVGSARALVDSHVLRLGEQPYGRWCEGSFMLRNAGHAPLKIRAVESSPGIEVVWNPHQAIAPHKGERIVVRLNTEVFGHGAAVGQVTLITNDPEHPVIRLRVTALVVER